MRNEFIMSTTNTIEGCPIKKYIDTICSNIVIGTNIFSDFAASFTDFFFFFSDSYRRKLEIIYSEASKALKQKALNMGANAIVGFKVDFDEISGKDKSMFMVSVSGTACIIEINNSKESSQEEIIRSSISHSDLQREIDRRYIISQINNSEPLIPEWVEFLLEYPQIEIIESLIKKYISIDINYYAEQASSIKQIIAAAPSGSVIPIIYKYVEDKKIRSLIKECRLFDGESIYKILTNGKIHEGIRVLSATKDSYDTNDLEWMKKILEYINNLPDTGKIESVKGGVFTRDNGEKYICENGHKNPVDSPFCEKCGVNIKGLLEGEIKHIDSLKERCSIIEEYIQ